MAAAMLFSVAVLGYERAACTPGGTFEPSADTDCSLMAYAWWQPLLAFSILAIVLFAVLWFFDVSTVRQFPMIYMISVRQFPTPVVTIPHRDADHRWCC
ncbi:hypothetical protein SVIRM249S_00555 [Streptomyces viridochromogenes]